MTSRDVVNRVQTWFPRRTKIGHTGTLDPLATGVLVICVGAATRLADVIQSFGKTYQAVFQLGVTSPSDDADGPIQPYPDARIPTRAAIEQTLSHWIGWIEQVPPVVSALKIAGRRAHELVRQGEDVRLQARPVRIDAIRLGNYDWPFLELEVDCGKGTYIRSLARDLGAALHCGGIVHKLRRTRVGPFTTQDALSIDTPPEAIRLRPVADALKALPTITLVDCEATQFAHGQPLQLRSGLAVHNDALATTVGVFDAHGQPLGVGILSNNRLRPSIVLPRATS